MATHGAVRPPIGAICPENAIEGAYQVERSSFVGWGDEKPDAAARQPEMWIAPWFCDQTFALSIPALIRSDAAHVPSRGVYI